MEEQNWPIEDGNDASDADKLAGIVAQTQGDISQGNVGDVPTALRQRLTDAGLEVDDAAFDELLGKLL